MPGPEAVDMDEYVDSLERLIFSSLAFAPDFRGLEDALDRLWQWHDVDRFSEFPGSAGLDSTFTTAAEFEIVPMHKVWPAARRSCGLGGRYMWMIPVGAIALGFAVGLGIHGVSKAAKEKRRRRIAAAAAAASQQSTDTRPAIVVLGADSPAGHVLVARLENAGFIVIASVSSADGIAEFESKFKGYVKAIVLDPEEPSSSTTFFRSVQSALSLTFPLDATIAPNNRTSPIMHPRLHTIISLLGLSPPVPHSFTSVSPLPLNKPLTPSLSSSSYLPYLARTHATPLQTIHTLLPLFLDSSARSRFRARDMRGKNAEGAVNPRNIIVCLPKVDERLKGRERGSLTPGTGKGTDAQAMSAAATACGLDLLRHQVQPEVTTTLTSRRKTILDDEKKIKDLRIYTVDVHSLAAPSELADALVDITGSRVPVVTGMGAGAGTRTRTCVFRPLLQCWHVRIRDWFRGDRFSVGGPSLLSLYTQSLISYIPLRLRRGFLVFGRGMGKAYRKALMEFRLAAREAREAFELLDSETEAEPEHEAEQTRTPGSENDQRHGQHEQQPSLAKEDDKTSAASASTPAPIQLRRQPLTSSTRVGSRAVSSPASSSSMIPLKRSQSQLESFHNGRDSDSQSAKQKQRIVSASEAVASVSTNLNMQDSSSSNLRDREHHSRASLSGLEDTQSESVSVDDDASGEELAYHAREYHEYHHDDPQAGRYEGHVHDDDSDAPVAESEQDQHRDSFNTVTVEQPQAERFPEYVLDRSGRHLGWSGEREVDESWISLAE